MGVAMLIEPRENPVVVPILIIHCIIIMLSWHMQDLQQRDVQSAQDIQQRDVRLREAQERIVQLQVR